MRGSTNINMVYKAKSKDSRPVEGNVDSDYVGNLDTRKSLIGCIFTLFGTTVS